MEKRTKSEEAVDSLDGVIDGTLKNVKKKASKPKGKRSKKTISFQVNRSLLSSSLGIIDQLIGLSNIMRTHMVISENKMIIRGLGTKRAAVKLKLEEKISGTIEIQPELKTLMELSKKFSSKIITLSINIESYKMTVKDKNVITKLICNPIEIDPADKIEEYLKDDILTLKGPNLEIFSNANLNSKMASSSKGNFTRVLVYPKSKTLSYYITNGALINCIESDIKKGEPIELNLENQEMVSILKVMNSIKNYDSVLIRTFEDSPHKFIDINSPEMRVVFNISEIDSTLGIESLIEDKGKEIDTSLNFIFLPYKFLDFIKKASPIIKNDRIDELIMLINSKGKVEMRITGQSGNIIRSQYNIEKLKGFDKKHKEVKICLLTAHFALILEHFASKPARFSCLGDLSPGGDKLVFLSYNSEEKLLSYKSMLATMTESDTKTSDEPPF